MQFEIVPIFWATNRNVKTKAHVVARSNFRAISFGSKRASTLAKGIALVTIPKVDRAFGSIPRPREYTLLSIQLYREEEDPRRHFTISKLERLSDAAYLKHISDRLVGSASFTDQCFVYVHGYRNTFEDAIFRAAQISVDMKFDGAAFVYSWPSQGRVAGYLTDRDSVDASQPHFQKFLKFLSEKTTCERVHIIAHSMGTRLVVDAFFPASRMSPLQDLNDIGQIVLAAPDIDAAVLKTRAAAIQQSAITVTLYANGHDDALHWSKRAAGGFERAGDVINGKPLILPGVDTIDLTPMSKATWVFIGANHNEYAERAHVLQDIALLMKNGLRPPEKRFAVFKSASHEGGRYWKYVSN